MPAVVAVVNVRVAINGLGSMTPLVLLFFEVLQHALGRVVCLCRELKLVAASKMLELML